MKEIILNLYFDKKLKQIEIAQMLGLSKSKVSRIITNDERYAAEKQTRKELNNIKHIKNTKKYIKNQRDKYSFRNNMDDLILKQMHKQASAELSKSNKLSDIAYRNWNTSAYTYNKDKNRFEFRKELGRSSDIKKYLKNSI